MLKIPKTSYWQTEFNSIELKCIIVLILIISACAGAYATYVLTAQNVTFVESDGSTIPVSEALNFLYSKQPRILLYPDTFFKM